mmetsp:Transcript_23024/g.30465  ORF Transcript_23024/g.30465 Transcript_23024/m.30465 type:complete len:142 (+) Transcript_23024:379-804(+)
MNTIAAQVPTLMEELPSCGIIGENVERENGKRLIQSIRSFVELENQQKYIDVNGPKLIKMAQQVTRATPAKRPLDFPTALPAKAPAVIDVTDDEFDVGIDFITIGILAVKVAPTRPRAGIPQSSSYFQRKKKWFVHDMRSL